MFERFRVKYGPLQDPAPASTAIWRDNQFNGVEGYVEFMAEFAGASFCSGLYRVHDERSGPNGLRLICESFPHLAARVAPFGYDWLGRQFAVDLRRRDLGQPQVLLLEPGTGEILEVPVSFVPFHDEELIEFAEAALAKEFFERWAAAKAGELPLRRDQCAGYRVPLFLGGRDAVENLEVIDLDVYWSTCGQLRRGTMHLSPGTSVNEVAKKM